MVETDMKKLFNSIDSRATFIVTLIILVTLLGGMVVNRAKDEKQDACIKKHHEYILKDSVDHRHLLKSVNNIVETINKCMDKIEDSNAEKDIKIHKLETDVEVLKTINK